MKLKYFLSLLGLTLLLLLGYYLYVNSKPQSNDVVATNQTPKAVASNNDRQEIKPSTGTTVTITSTSKEDTPNDNNTILLGDLKSKEFVQVVIQGTIKDFTYQTVSFDGDKLLGEKMMNEFPEVTNKTILIRTTIPEGVPSEMLTWKSISGKEYSFVISYNGETGKVEKTFTLE